MLSAGQHLQHIGLENNHAMLINNPSGNLIPDGHKDDTYNYGKVYYCDGLRMTVISMLLVQHQCALSCFAANQGHTE